MAKKPLILNKQGLKSLYRQAARDDQAELTSTTLLLLDVHDLGLGNCQSILIDKRRGKLWTKDSTTTLLKRFINWQNTDFFPAMQIMKQLHAGSTHHHAVPFVCGCKMIMPLSGYSRGATSWLFPLNLVHYTCLGAKQVGLQFKVNAGPDYILNESFASFKSLCCDTFAIAQKEINFMQQLVADFPPSMVSHVQKYCQQTFHDQDQTAPTASTTLKDLRQQLITDVIRYTSSLIGEQPSADYLNQVNYAINHLYLRLR